MGLWDTFLDKLSGIAHQLLQGLIGKAGRERDRWARQYLSYETQIAEVHQEIRAASASVSHALSYAQAEVLHSRTVATADSVYASFTIAHKALDAIGETIVETAKQRKRLEIRARSQTGNERRTTENQIKQLQHLRDDILIPDKDRIRDEKNRLLRRVHELNMEAGRLRDLKARIRVRELPARTSTHYALPAPSVLATVKWFNPAEGYGFVSTPHGDAYLSAKVVPTGMNLPSNSTVRCTLERYSDGKLRVLSVRS